MRLAIKSDFNDIKSLFYKHKEIFPHIRQDKLLHYIETGNCIYDNEVAITFNVYKRKVRIGYRYSFFWRKVRIGNIVANKGDCILHQIVSKSGKASKILQDFFKYIDTKVYLTVRESNTKAIDFYLKNDMLKIGEIAWKNNTIPGKIFLYNATT